MSPSIVALYLQVFGGVTLVGGVIGFVKAKSKASLIAGGISGALLGVAGWLIGQGSTSAGLVLGLVVSLALAGRFGVAFKRSKKVIPAGLILVLALVGIVLAGLALARP